MPLLDPGVVPAVLGAAPHRVLLADVPGQDQYDARGEVLHIMARMLIDLQASWIDRVPELEALDLLDKRATASVPRIHSVVDRNRHELDENDRRGLDSLVEGLPQRFADLEACGIPGTLVHGDFHPGNIRGMPGHYRILDWGDCGIGHPMLDLRPSLEYFTRASSSARSTSGKASGPVRYPVAMPAARPSWSGHCVRSTAPSSTNSSSTTSRPPSVPTTKATPLTRSNKRRR